MIKKIKFISALFLLFTLPLPSFALEVDYEQKPAQVIGYKATWLHQSTIPSQFHPGESFSLSVQYLNSGQETWDQGTCLNIYKDPQRKTAPTNDYDKAGNKKFGTSYWQNTDWEKNHRPVCVEGIVPPGEKTTLNFTISIPADTPPGQYYEDLSLGVDKEGKQGWIYANAPYGQVDSEGKPGTGDPHGVAHLWLPIKIISSSQPSPSPTETKISKKTNLFPTEETKQQLFEEENSERASIFEKENSIFSNSSRNNNSPLPSRDKKGEYFFSGQGRDLYQGHSLGLSQLGAYGGAKKGMSAKEIIQFYYHGVEIMPVGIGKVEIINQGQMDIEEYLAGLGEVPDKACGNSTQVKNNPEKYALDSSDSIWDCWPEEAIKAQVIAARAFALTKNCPLYTDARHQVYKGGEGKKWAAEETRSLVPTYKGQIIQAFYSMDNNQGHGSANHETIWSNYEGEKNYLPYLRAADDSKFALHSSWTYWKWETGNFDLSELNNILSYGAEEMGSPKNFINQVLNKVGQIKNVELVRDPSQRVWKINLIGTRGEKEIAGWLFKALWNEAASQELAPGFIYSLTFYLEK